MISSLKREHLSHQAVGFGAVLFGVRLSLIIKGWRPFGRGGEVRRKEVKMEEGKEPGEKEKLRIDKLHQSFLKCSGALRRSSKFEIFILVVNFSLNCLHLIKLIFTFR